MLNPAKSKVLTHAKVKAAGNGESGLTNSVGKGRKQSLQIREKQGQTEQHANDNASKSDGTSTSTDLSSESATITRAGQGEGVESPVNEFNGELNRLENTTQSLGFTKLSPNSPERRFSTGVQIRRRRSEVDFVVSQQKGQLKRTTSLSHDPTEKCEICHRVVGNVQPRPPTPPDRPSAQMTDLVRRVRQKTRTSELQQWSTALIDAAFSGNIEEVLNCIGWAMARFPATHEDPKNLLIELEEHLRARKERLLDMFRDMDKDSSGGISFEELMDGMARRGVQYSRRQGMVLMDFLDSDGDGVIDYREMTFARKVMSCSGSSTAASASHVFQDSPKDLSHMPFSSSGIQAARSFAWTPKRNKTVTWKDTLSHVYTEGGCKCNFCTGFQNRHNAANRPDICPCKYCQRPLVLLCDQFKPEFVGPEFTLADFVDMLGFTTKCSSSEPRSALSWASMKGHQEIVQFLVCCAGATVDMVDPLSGMVPLHMAAVRGHTNIAELLIDHGADTNEQDRSGCTAGYLAASFGNAALLKRMYANGWDPAIVNDSGWTALHAAASGGHSNCVVQLLNWGVDIDAITIEGDHALHLAVSGDHVPCEALVLDHAVDRKCTFFFCNRSGQNALELSRAISKIKSMIYLEKEHAKLMEKVPPHAGRFPLHAAAYDGDHGKVRQILLDSDDPDVLVIKQDDGGSTALHKAGGNGKLRCIEILLRHNKSEQKQIRNFKAQTAYETAIAYSQLRAAKLIGPNDDKTDIFASLGLLATDENGRNSFSHKIGEGIVDEADTEVEVQDNMVERYFNIYARYDMIVRAFKSNGGVLPDEEEHSLHIKLMNEMVGRANDRIRATLIEIEKIKAETDKSKETILKMVIKGKFKVDAELKEILSL